MEMVRDMLEALKGLERSQLAFERARRTVSGGVNSSVRLGELPIPLFFERGEGSQLWDIDGNKYIDYVMGQGPLLLGHSPAVVIDAVKRQLGWGLLYGGEHEAEAELAEVICATVSYTHLDVYKRQVQNKGEVCYENSLLVGGIPRNGDSVP